MKKQDLAKKLNEKDVRVDSFSLEGGLPNEAYCLNKTKDCWEVYYSERGRKSELKKFTNESDACQYLYEVLVDQFTS